MSHTDVTFYEKQLRSMVEKRMGTFDEFLAPQLRASAMCWQMLEKTHQALMAADLTVVEVGSMGQSKTAVHPLMATYKDLQRTLLLHYKALGLNYDTTPSKVTENTRKGSDASTDPLARLYQESIQYQSSSSFSTP